MRILVTGGAGFIGSHVVELYLRSGHTVAVLDDLSTGKRAQVPSSVEFFQGGIEDPKFIQKVLDEFKPEVINHHAAQISVVNSTKDPLGDAQKNILGTINLLEKASHVPSFKKFIYASSGGAMYGNPTILPCTEETLPLPVSPYGLSKYTAERYVWQLSELYQFPATVLRYSNVYGPRQDPHGEAGVCAIFCGKMLNGEAGTIFGDGSQVRDYIYVEDVAAANLAALEKGTGDSFNIGTEVGTSTLEVFEAIKEATGFPGNPTIGPARPGEVQAVILSAQKAKKWLGWQAAHTFKEGIQKTIAWYKS